MFCRNCGYEQDGGRFCDRCGQPIYMPRPDAAAPRSTPPGNDFGGYYDNNYDNSYQNDPDETFSYDDGYQDPAYAGDGYYQDRYANNYDNYYDNRYQETAYDETDYYQDDGYGYSDNVPPPRQRPYRSDGGAGVRGQSASSDRKSNAMIIFICIGICAVGIFLIWTVFKLITGEDTNGNGSYVTTAPAVKTTTVKPAVTPAPVETTTPKEKPATKKAEIISAATLAGMDVSDILDAIGDDYRISWNEYERDDGTYFCGITSDNYFPNVLISYPDEDFGDEDDLLELFESGEDEGVFIAAMNGGVIGDGMKVGDSYHDMMTKINCLGGIDTGNDFAVSIVGGRLCYLQFDGSDDLDSVSRKYGSDIVDGFSTDYKCVYAEFSDDFSFGESVGGTVTAYSVALRVAPYADSSNLWNLNPGEKIKVSKKDGIISSDGSAWYRVYEYRTDNGVWKHGYIHAEYVKLD